MKGNNQELFSFVREAFEKTSQELSECSCQLVPYGKTAEGATKNEFEELREAVARIERRLDLIFGDAVLINGRFVDVKNGGTR